MSHQRQHAAATAAQQQQAMLDQDQKKVQDFVDALTFIGNIRDDINTILENVGKANTANNYALILGSNSRASAANAPNGATSAPGSDKSAAHDESAASSSSSSSSATIASNNNNKLDAEQQQFFEKSDTKYLQERIVSINRNLSDLDKVIKELQPVQFININDFNSLLLNNVDVDKLGVTGSKLVRNYRWTTKIQENITSTNLMPYKRFQQTYAEKKSSKYTTYSIKPNKKEDIEKLAATHLTNNEIRVVSAQKTDNQFVLDIIMPQYFKFVVYLFDTSVEKLQVRQLDSRALKIYGNNKPSDEICYIDTENRHLSNVFQRLEENCLYACLHFRTEQGAGHFRYLLYWLKNFFNLFNAKCVRCEKHLVNGVPPTWRDLKTFEAYHDECRL